jgi:hypothetical protein
MRPFTGRLTKSPSQPPRLKTISVNIMRMNSFRIKSIAENSNNSSSTDITSSINIKEKAID